MNNLQKTLRLNVIFSGVSALFLIFFNQKIAQVFEVENTTVFLVIGLALVWFAGTILFEIKRQRPKFILAIILQDYLWVIGSLAILIFQPFNISEKGNGIIAVVALIVLLLGLNQQNALAQMKNTNDNQL